MDIDRDELQRRLPSAKQIASDFYGVKWKSNRATCPRAANHAHGDRDPSFVFLPRENRLKCFSQMCFGDKPVDVFDFVGQMEGRDFQGAVHILAQRYCADSASRKSKGRNSYNATSGASSREQLESEGWCEMAKYSMGEGVRKVRFEHPDRLQTPKNRPEKTFIWEHCDRDGAWKPGRGGRAYLAYVNTPFRDLDQIEWALGVEAERSADTVAMFGLAAFSFKEITAENAAAFAGLDLCLLPDKDVAGRATMHSKIQLLQCHARSITVIEPPDDWPDAGDIHDAINQMGWTRDQVKALLATATSYKVNPQFQIKAPAASRLWTLASLRTANFKAPESIVEDLVAEGETICLVGKPKAGKSRLAQGIALAVSRGESFLGHGVPKARRVLVLDLENRAAGVRTRFEKMSRASPADELLFIYAPETLSDLRITLTTDAGIKALQQLVAEVKPDLLIIDTWRLLLGGDENKTEVVVKGLRALSSLRQLLPTLAILIVHHTRKTQGPDPPVLRVDPSAWVENASGHHALIAHVDACFGLEREIDRKTGDELIVFGGVSRSAAARTLLLDEDLDTLVFRTADTQDVVQKLLTDKERAAWTAVQDLPEFTFSDVVDRAQTKNRKLVASLLRKLTSMNAMVRGLDAVYRRPGN